MKQLSVKLWNRPITYLHLHCPHCKFTGIPIEPYLLIRYTLNWLQAGVNTVSGCRSMSDEQNSSCKLNDMLHLITMPEIDGLTNLLISNV